MHYRIKSLSLATATLLISLTSPLLPLTWRFEPLVVQAQTTQDRATEARQLLQKGSQQYRQALLKEALETFQQALEIYKQFGDKAGEAESLNRIGEVYNQLSQNSDALEVLQQALSIARELGDRKGEGETLYSLGRIYRVLEQYSQALEHYQQSLVIARELGLRTVELSIVNTIGGIHHGLKQYSQALEHYQQALSIAREIDDRHEQGKTLYNIGKTYRVLEQYSQALEHYQQSLVIARELGLRTVELSIVNTIGGIHHGLKQYSQALENYQQALSIARELGDRDEEDRISRELARIYVEIHDDSVRYSEAIAFFEQIRTNLRNNGERELEARLLTEIAEIVIEYQDERHYPKAVEFYRQAINIFRSVSNHEEEAKTVIWLAKLYERSRQYSEAIKAYQQKLDIDRTIQNREEEASTLHKIANLYRILSEHSKEIEIYQRILATIRETGIWDFSAGYFGRMDESDVLITLGRAYHQLGQYSEEMESYEQALTVTRAVSDRERMLALLRRIGEIYRQQQQYPEALKVYQQALAIAQEISKKSSSRRQEIKAIINPYVDPDIEVEALIDLSVVYHLLGEGQAESNYYQRALVVSRNISGAEGEFVTIYRLASIYDNSLILYPKAIELYQQALTIARTINTSGAEIYPLLKLGDLYLLVGPYQKAVESYQEAIKIYKTEDVSGHIENIEILSEIGIAYHRIGQYAEAIQAYQQVLNAPNNPFGNDFRRIVTMNNIGTAYRDLGQYQQAVDLHRQALAIAQQHSPGRDEVGEAVALDNLGMTYQALGQHQTAIKFHQQALEMFRWDDENRNEAATALNNLGTAYQALGQYQNATESHQQAMQSFREIGNRGGEAHALNNLGEIYRSLGQSDRAIEFYQQSLAIKQDIGDHGTTGLTLSNIGYLLAQKNQPELAIVFYKQSVNVTEKIRKDLRVLPKDLQQSYTETVASTYHRLADLLLQQDRVLEAQRVLDLLKVQELDDYLSNVRGNTNTAQGLPHLPAEQQTWTSYQTILNKAVEIGKELTQLRQLKQNGTLTPAQEQRIAQLVKAQETIREEFNNFTRSPEVLALVTQRSPESLSQDLLLQMGNFNALQDNLKNLQQNAVLLYPLILDDRIELILTTPDSPPIRRTVPVPKKQLNETIVAFRSALQNPTSDAKIPAQKLYNWLIKPLEEDLKTANAQTIIYAPDAQLRYIPLAALHDGEQWLVQRYRINNITAASLTDLNTKPQPKMQVLAGAFATGRYSFKVGKQSFDFAGLPFAGTEVENLAKTVPTTTKFIDTAFTPQVTVPKMDDYSIVHLATHAAFVVGTPDDSFILFGNGERITLRDIQTWSLKNVDLVVLSACETGLGGKLGNGEEILGLGYQMQRAGARAAIASLWTVDDGGTQALMNAFYAHLKQGNTTKAEALRQAQIALITDDYTASLQDRGLGLEERNNTNPSPKVANQLGHPYYWAPFILIGNGL